MVEWAVEIGTWIVSVGGAGAVLVAIARVAVPHLLARDLVEFKHDLQRTAAVEVERLKSELSRAQTEHDVRFRWLHAKQGDALEETHGAYVKAAAAIKSAAGFAELEFEHGPFPGTDFKGDIGEAVEAKTNFERAVLSAGSFVPESLEPILEEARKHMNRGVAALTQVSYTREPNRVSENQANEARVNLRAFLTDDAAVAKRVVDGFRQAYGGAPGDDG